MDIKELGALLRAEREAQGLTLEDVFQRTKISVSTLRDIEAGEIDDLPHPVYLKGFIKNYARLLGLDDDKLVAAFTKSCLLDMEEEACKQENTADRDKGWQVAGLFLLFLLFIVGAGWFFLRQGQMQDQLHHDKQSLDTAVRHDDVQAGAGNSSSLSKSGSQEGKEQVSSGQDLASPHAARPADPARADLQDQAVQDQAPLAGGENSTLSPLERGGGSTKGRGDAGLERFGRQMAEQGESIDLKDRAVTPESDSAFHVRVVARENCWLKATTAGVVKEYLLTAGQEQDFPFRSSLDLKLGNAGGVEVFFQGRPYVLNATSGQVLTLHFP